MSGAGVDRVWNRVWPGVHAVFERCVTVLDRMVEVLTGGNRRRILRGNKKGSEKNVSIVSRFEISGA